GNIDGHRAPANFQCNAAAGGALPGFWNFDATVMQQVANDAQSLLEFDQLRCCSSETVDRPVTRAQTDYGPALGNFIQRGEGIGGAGGIPIDHNGYRRTQANRFPVQCAHSHDLIWIDVVHVTVGEKDRLNSRLTRSPCGKAPAVHTSHLKPETLAHPSSIGTLRFQPAFAHGLHENLVVALVLI